MKRQAETTPAELEKEVKEEVAVESTPALAQDATVVAENNAVEKTVTATVAEESKEPATGGNAEEEKKEGPLQKPFLGKKVRIAILCGYNGINFHGSQKNDSVRSVEAEIEKGLHAIKMISDFNVGDLKKIGWGRATRTDKRVHALQNTFSAKVLIAKRPFITVRDESGNVVEYKNNCSLDEHLDELRTDLNAILPADVRVFSMFVVSNRF